MPAKCALFVCNKWDQVPENEDKEVRCHIVKKLKQSWPNLDPSTQITFMSTLNATTAQNLGIVTEEFSSLMEGIKSMVLQGIECRMEIHWRYSKLDNVLLFKITYILHDKVEEFNVFKKQGFRALRLATRRQTIFQLL